MKKIITVFFAFLFALFTPLTVRAYNEIKLIQAFMRECDIDIFLSDDLDEQSLSVKVANNEVDVIDFGTINEAKILTRTTILIDISNSVPTASRDKVSEFLKYQVENITENEEIRILTFGNEVNILQEFTSDRYDLSKAVERIVYNGTQSAVYDAIYNTMPELNFNYEEPCFYRTVVVTDGADHAAHGITKEELLMKLQSTTYPIDVICVNKAKPKNSNKDLSSLTRISNGRYYDIYPGSDIRQIYSVLSVKDYYWIRASVPYKYLDGSIRQVDVQDDRNHVSFDIKMSVVDYNITEESDVYTLVTEENIWESDSMSSITEAADAAQNDDNENAGFTLILLILGIAVVLLIIIVVFICLHSRKKPADDAVMPYKPRIYKEYYHDDNEFKEKEYCYDDNEIYLIKISDAFDITLSWTIEISSEIIIGRADNCDITLTDKSVSHEQCKIAVRAKGLVIQNLSSSNHTKLNGNKVNEEILLHSSDILHFGRVTLRVDSIQKIGAAEKKVNTDDKNKTDDVWTEVVFEQE